MRTETVITGGKERTVVADENYIRNSIKEPAADVVKGYPNIMPKMPLSDQDVSDLIEYIKSVK